MGSGCDREVIQQLTAPDGGAVMTEEEIKTDPETIETGGPGGARIKLRSIAMEPRYLAVTF